MPGDPVDGATIARYDSSLCVVSVDTVPAFPSAFGPPGVYYATRRDSLDRPVVIRYDLDRGSGPRDSR